MSDRNLCTFRDGNVQVTIDRRKIPASINLDDPAILGFGIALIRCAREAERALNQVALQRSRPQPAMETVSRIRTAPDGSLVVERPRQQ
jgi:hypothetical protein